MGVGPVGDLDEVLLDEEDPTIVIKVANELKVEIKAHKDMLGISPSVISHVLNIDKNYPPVQQKRDCLTKTDLKP